MTDKRAKIEQRINVTNEKMEAEKPNQKDNADEATEAQKEENRKFITELFEQQQTKYQEDIQTISDKYRQQLMTNETLLRQKDAKIAQLELLVSEQNKTPDEQKTVDNKETDTHKTADDQHDFLFNGWPGKSPGPEVMQRTIGIQNKEIPMHTNIQTPDKEWSDIFDDTVKYYRNHVSKTGRRAFEELIVQGSFIHNFRELVEQQLPINTEYKGRFKCLQKRDNDDNPEIPRRTIIKPVYTPDYSSQGGSSPGGGDGGGVHNLGVGGNGGQGGGHGGPPEDDEPQVINYSRANDYERTDKEFQLVNARNINITPSVDGIYRVTNICNLITL